MRKFGVGVAWRPNSCKCFGVAPYSATLICEVLLQLGEPQATIDG
jgi:hypothetical protein